MTRSNNKPRQNDQLGGTQLPSPVDNQRWGPSLSELPVRMDGEQVSQTQFLSAITPSGSAEPTLSKLHNVSYRPTRRPMIALVFICDDLGSGGEWFRVRHETCVIGRTEGDIRIPNDPAISGKHVQLRLVTTPQVTGETTSEWLLEDLGSRNGTFVRVTSVLLVNGQQFMLGNRLFRIEVPFDAATTAPPLDVAVGGTNDWTKKERISTKHGTILVEITPKRPQGGRKFKVSRSEVYIGSDTTRCQVAITKDPFVGPVHAKLSYRGQEGWQLVDLDSANGCWLRIDKHPLKGPVDVQIGEQRLRIQLGGTDLSVDA